jgi:hypothetical protein
VSFATNPTTVFLECALAANAEFIVTVNTASGHFDRKQYQTVSVARPGEFLNVPEVGRLVKKLIRDLIVVAPAIDSAGSLGRVKGSLRRCAPLTRPTRSRVGSIDRSDQVMTTPQLRLTIGAFSGERERERSDRRGRPLQRRVGRRATCGHVIGALARERLIETKLTAGRERCGVGLRLAYGVAQVCNADARDHRRVAKDGWRAGEVVEESNSGAKKNRRDVDVDFVEEASIQ